LNASKNSEVEILFVRDGQLMQSQLQVNENGKLGVEIRQAFRIFPYQACRVWFFEAIPAGISLGWETLASYIKQFKLVFSERRS